MTNQSLLDPIHHSSTQCVDIGVDMINIGLQILMAGLKNLFFLFIPIVRIR